MHFECLISLYFHKIRTKYRKKVQHVVKEGALKTILKSWLACHYLKKNPDKSNSIMKNRNIGHLNSI